MRPQLPAAAPSLWRLKTEWQAPYQDPSARRLPKCLDSRRADTSLTSPKDIYRLRTTDSKYWKATNIVDTLQFDVHPDNLGVKQGLIFFLQNTGPPPVPLLPKNQSACLWTSCGNLTTL